MFRNYFIITIRNLFKNGFYSFINITGLSIGITCSILILLWVYDEISYDKIHPKVDRIYQVWAKAFFDGKVKQLDIGSSSHLRGDEDSGQQYQAVCSDGLGW